MYDKYLTILLTVALTVVVFTMVAFAAFIGVEAYTRFIGDLTCVNY